MTSDQPNMYQRITHLKHSMFNPKRLKDVQIPCHRNKVKWVIALILACIALYGYRLCRYEDCPFVYGNVDLNRSQSPTSEVVACSSYFLQGHGISHYKEYKYCIPHNTLSEREYLHLTLDCKHFRTTLGYNRFPVIQEEKDFPIAFSILMYNHVHQAERLLRAIYRPHNFYCLHVDADAPGDLLAAMSAIAECLPNVFLSSQRVKVSWGGIGVVLAEVTCIRDLLKKSPKWKYFINLTGHEMPLKTNLELVRILKRYNGSNDIEAHGKPFKDRIEYVWNGPHRTEKKKPPPPHGFKIAKGSAHIVASRGFVYYATHSKVALDLLDWLNDTRVPDEHYFNTLQHHVQQWIPGKAESGFGTVRPSRIRVKWWVFDGGDCGGIWVRYVCNFGVRDLRWLATAPELFANKFDYESSPIALDCIEQWYHKKAKESTI